MKAVRVLAGSLSLLGFLLIGRSDASQVVLSSSVACDDEGQVEPDIIFGSFGIEDDESKVSQDTTTTASETDSDAVATASDLIDEALKCYKVSIVREEAPKDRFEELERFEMLQRSRFNMVDDSPASFRNRISNDHPVWPLTDYSLPILEICTEVLDWPRETLDLEIQEMFLKKIFAVRGRGVAMSLVHPICSDALKILAGGLNASQASWLVKNAPTALLDNVVLLKNLPDYSFMTPQVFELVKSSHCSGALDFLTIPNFVRTAPVDCLMIFLMSSYLPSLHWPVLEANRPLEGLLEMKELVEGAPQFYGFFCEFSGHAKLRPAYAADASPIIEAIRRDGLGPLLLASLLAYVQETNEMIRTFMTQIAEAWAYGHRNSHLNCEDIAAINAEFNELCAPLVGNLLYLKAQRDAVSDLVADFEADRIRVKYAISQAIPDWVKSLRLLVDTPFDAMVRMSYANRMSALLLTVIDPADRANLVPLPQLTSTTPLSGFNIEAMPTYTMSPYLWSALWRHGFFENGDLWREDPDSGVVDPAEFEATWKAKYQVIYRDTPVMVQPDELLAAWLKLTKPLPETFTTGHRLQKFLASIAMPDFTPEKVVMDSTKVESSKAESVGSSKAESVESTKAESVESSKVESVESSESVKLATALPVISQDLIRKASIARKVFEKRVALAIGKMHTFDFGFEQRIHSCFASSAVVLEALDAIKQIPVEAGFGCKSTAGYIEELCTQVATLFLGTPNMAGLFSALRCVDAAFATLGDEFTRELLFKMAASPPILMVLSMHSRAFTPKQIENLLSRSIGRAFLAGNEKTIRKLVDYSAFTAQNLQQLNLSIHEIEHNAASLEASVALEALKAPGYLAALDDPVKLVFALGKAFWASSSCSFEVAGELISPVVVAFDTEFAKNVHFMQKMAQLKLNSETEPTTGLVLIIKWLISQESFAFTHRIIKNKGAEFFGKKFIERLDSVYHSYITTGEPLGRSTILQWIENTRKSRTNEISEAFESIKSALNSPLTHFRASLAKTTVNCPLARLHASSCYSDGFLAEFSSSQAQSIRALICRFFPKEDQFIWLARFDILNEITATANRTVDATVIHDRLQKLPLWDALFYKLALEMEGVSVLDIFKHKTLVQSEKQFGGLLGVSNIKKNKGKKTRK